MRRQIEGLDTHAERLQDSFLYETLLGEALWSVLPLSLQERIWLEVRISRAPEIDNNAGLSHGTPAANLITAEGWRRIKDMNPTTVPDFREALHISSGGVDRRNSEKDDGTTFNLQFFGVLPTVFAAIRGELDDTYLLTYARLLRAALLYSLWGAVLELKSKIEIPEITEITFDSTVKGGMFVWAGCHPREISHTFSLKGAVGGMSRFLGLIREGRYDPSSNIIEIFGLSFRWKEWILALQHSDSGYMDSIISHMHKWYKDNSNRWGELLRRVDSAVSRAAQLISEPYDEWPPWLLWAQALAVTTVQFTPEKLPPYVVNTKRPTSTLRPWVGFPLEGARSVKIIIPAPVGQTLRHLGVSLQDFKQMIVDLVKEHYMPRNVGSVIKKGTKWQCTLNYSNEAEGSR